MLRTLCLSVVTAMGVACSAASPTAPDVGGALTTNASQANAASAPMEQQMFDISDDVRVVNCTTGAPTVLHLQGQVHVMQKLSDDFSQLIQHWNYQGVSGVTDAGVVYRAQRTYQLEIIGLHADDNAMESFESMLRLIGPGPNNDFLIHVHTTFVRANGEIHVDRMSFTSEDCL